jgi:hemoglobin-like flavoprotein
VSLTAAEAQAIEASLEAVAEAGDPTDAVYARLFAANPELEALFVMGRDAKGHMLDEAIRVVLDYVGPRSYATGFLRAEVVNHENLGVPPDRFADFFPVVRDSFRELAGAAWTPEMESAWAALIGELTAAL